MKAETKFDVEYQPTEDEPFMNPRQLDYFRRKLLAWKASILAESRGTIEHMQEGTRNIPDIADRASEETDRALELRTRDRQRKVVSKIDAALRRIEEGTYGYCEETGEPISLKRLDARPIATLSRSRRRSATSARSASTATTDTVRRSGARGIGVAIAARNLNPWYRAISNG